MVPVLVLLFVALWFILRGDLFYVLCYFVLVFFSLFSIATTSLGEERANLSAFRTSVWFVLIWFCRFPFPLGVCEGLRFVIKAFPGLFSYPFFLKHWYLYHKLRKTFSRVVLPQFWYPIKGWFESTFARRSVHLKLYGDLVYKFRKVVGKTDYLEQFKKIITRYKLQAWLFT